MTATKTSSSGKLIRRTSAARLLRVSVSTLRRLEGSELNPIVDAGGVHMFDETEVLSLRHRREQSILAPTETGGAIAADVFALLDTGAHPVDIVKQLRIAPQLVISLQEQWVAMREGFAVTSQQAKDLARLMLVESFSGSADKAIADIRARVEDLARVRYGSTKCRVCRARTAAVCSECGGGERARLAVVDATLEQRVRSDGAKEVRVRAGIHRNFGKMGDATVVHVHSPWYVERDICSSDVADVVSVLRDSPTLAGKANAAQ